MQKLEMNIIASIILYNPDIYRLRQNIQRILPQVDEIIVIDNASQNHSDVHDCLKVFSKVTYRRNSENVGIAKALNQAAQYACDSGYDWIITLDQDSVSPQNLVCEYSKLMDISNVGMICCKIVDRNFGEMHEQQIKTAGYEEIPMCITSASMLKLQAWKDVGGFPEDFFIDSVDFDICLSLREHGYKIIRTNDAALLHEVGHSEIRKLFGKEYQIYHHSPLRYYYMVRNGIYLGKRHGFVLRSIYRSLRLSFLVFLFEEATFKKALMMMKGFYHGIIGKYGKCN